MKLFTRGFLIDIIASCVFVLSMYSVIYNEAFHPTLPHMQGVWTIEVHQRPLVLGITGHNFLVLRNALGEEEGELHGLATNPTTNYWKHVGTDSTDILRVWEFKDSRYGMYGDTFPGEVIASGTADDMIALWNKGRSCADRINEKYIPYPPYGVRLRGTTENSNSVAYTLAKCMHITIDRMGLLTPGYGRDLLEK